MCGCVDYRISLLRGLEQTRWAHLRGEVIQKKRSGFADRRVFPGDPRWGKISKGRYVLLKRITCQEALHLTATFAFTADRMRAGDGTSEIRAMICERASRVAFLRAHLIAQREEMVPVLGDPLCRAIFAIA